MELTTEWLEKLITKEHKFYYSTPSLNECLYLNYKGF